MRVVNRQAFLMLPSGTIYCKGVRWAFCGLCIKAESLSNDWIYLDLAWPDANDSGESTSILDRSLADGTSFRSETSYGRDGCFDDDAVFLIFEGADIDRLRELIEAAPR